MATHGKSRSKSGKKFSSKILKKVHALEENKQRNKEVDKCNNSFLCWYIYIYQSYFADSLQNKLFQKDIR